MPMTRRFLRFAIWAALPVAGCFPHKEKDNGLRLASVQLHPGWGYRITYNNKPLIYQPCIPVLPGRKPFGSETDAMHVGNLVLYKLSHHLPPSVTRSELDSLRIQL